MRGDSTIEMRIPLSKRKIALLLLGAAALVGASVWLWFIADSQPEFNPVLVKVISLAGVSFFGLCGVYGCIKLFDNKPGLIIDKEGIVDNSSAVSPGRIFWSEITGLNVSVMAGQKFLTIEVANVQKYLERGGFFTRMANRTNTKMVGSPINISANALRLNFDELLRVLGEAFETYQRQMDQDAATGRPREADSS